MRQRRQGQVAISHLKRRGGLAQPLHDGGGNLAADGMGAENAGIDMEKFHGWSPLVYVCNWRYMSDRPIIPQERTFLKPEHTIETRAHQCSRPSAQRSRKQRLPRRGLDPGARRRQMERVR